MIARIVVYLWIFLFCRLIKYTEHFCRYPADLAYVPLIPLFGYYHSIWIKLNAMLTLQVVRIANTAGTYFLADRRSPVASTTAPPHCQRQ